MNVAVSATMDAIAVGLLVFPTDILVTEYKANGITLTDSLASNQSLLPMFFFY